MTFALLINDFMNKKGLIFLCFLFLSFASFSANEKDSIVDIRPTNYSILGTRVVDIFGETHYLGVKNKKANPVALVFIDIGCVISQRFIPYLNEMNALAKNNDVQFYGIISNPRVTWQEAQKFNKEYAIKFPILFDRNGDLANRIKPTVVPEAFVFDIYDELVYYGRINDQFADLGKFNKTARKEELKDAILAVGNNEDLAVAYATPKGCFFESWDDEIEEITFNQHIEPIIRANCVSCHQPNNVAPFPLISYDDVARRARMIAYVTKRRYMPIWKGEPNYGKFSNEHLLSDYQIKLIEDWSKKGKKEGDAAKLMAKPSLTNVEWKLGEPDMIVEMEAYNLPASGDDQYRVFVMDQKIPKGKILKAVDFKPGDPSVVHHTTVFVDYNGVLKKYDDENEEPGYDAFKKGGTMEFGSAVPVCGWAPGIEPYVYPEGVGFYVEGNAHVAIENHYHLSGKATTDQSYIGLYFADKPVTKYMTGSIMGSQKLHIPANSPEFSKSIWTYVPCDIELYDFTPHMHYIGKSVKMDIILPDGTIKPLLNLKDWDLRWQNVYTLRELTLIPKGSIIKADFVFDNSDDNSDNPYYPSQDMFWGWGSSDEMIEVYFSFIPVKFEDYGKTLSSSFVAFEHTWDYSERITVNKENLDEIADKYINVDVLSREGQILLYSIIESSMGGELMNVLKRKSNQHKTNTNFKINSTHLAVTEAYFSLDIQKMIKEGEKAAMVYYEILRKDENNWNANYLYAKTLLDSEVPKFEKQGIEVLKKLMAYQETISAEDKFANTYWDLGRYYFKLFKDKEAKAVLEQGLKNFPNNLDLKQELESDGRIVKKVLNSN